MYEGKIEFILQSKGHKLYSDVDGYSSSSSNYRVYMLIRDKNKMKVMEGKDSKGNYFAFHYTSENYVMLKPSTLRLLFDKGMIKLIK